jgi:hypothetical protein
VRSYLEKNQHNRAGRVAQVVECLPSKCEALSSPAPKKKKRSGKELGCYLVGPLLYREGDRGSKWGRD